MSGREQFIGWIADRFQERHAPPLPRAEAVADAAAALEGFEVMSETKFGDPDFEWGDDEDGSHAIADEEIHAGWEAA